MSDSSIRNMASAFRRGARLGRLEIDVCGAILLAAAVWTVAALLICFRVRQWLGQRRRMAPLAAARLRLAAARGRVDQLQLLRSLPGFQVDADNKGFTALMASAVEGHTGCTVWLLEQGADVCRQRADGWRDSVLHYAAGSGSAETVQALLAYGADPAATNAFCSTPADVATKAGHKQVAALLRAAAADGQRRPGPEDRAAFVRRYLPTAGSTQQANGGSSAAPASKMAAPPASPLTVQIAAYAGSGASAACSTARASLPDAQLAKQPSTAGARCEQDAEAATAKLLRRGFEGLGTPGTVPRQEMQLFRPLAVASQLLSAFYLTWRALATLRQGWGLLYSAPFWLAEFVSHCLSYCFLVGLFNMIERPPRNLADMLPEPCLPHVDIYIVTYSEPPQVVEPAAIAALNMNWPAARVTVHLLDDGQRPSMARLVHRLAAQCRHMKREANIVYVARDTAKGVPHHAKAGNINSCLLKEGPGKGEFVLVLDCDMIVHLDFLLRTLDHFYRQEDPEGGGEGSAGCGKWVLKDEAALVQTPQDFFNVQPDDQLGHCSRFFYGPMMQGHDGAGAAPCCGTGVVFRRDVLVSMRGQSYGSITEDYNTSMELVAAGFSTMYVNERLSYGLAPESISDMADQRLRWAMGALQVMISNNPLRLPGLTFIQALLFFDAAGHLFHCFPTLMTLIVPLVYLCTQYSPMVCENMWKFAAIFGSYYLCNRIMMWHIHRSTEGGLQALWRNTQLGVWTAPNQLRALWKVLVGENRLIQRLFSLELAFKVTRKVRTAEDEGWAALRAALWVVWPHLLFILLFLASASYYVVRAASGAYKTERDLDWKVVWRTLEPQAGQQPSRAAGLLRGLSQSLDALLSAVPGSPRSSPSKAHPENTATTFRGQGNGAVEGPEQPPRGAAPAAAGQQPQRHSHVPPRASRLGAGGPNAAGGGMDHLVGSAAALARATSLASSSSNKGIQGAGPMLDSSIGRIALRQRHELALQQSALLTAVVLPERSSSSRLGSATLMMDAAGHTAPCSGLTLRATSVHLNNLGSLPLQPAEAACLAGASSSSITASWTRGSAGATLAELTGYQLPAAAPPGSLSVDIDALLEAAARAAAGTAGASNVTTWDEGSSTPAAVTLGQAHAAAVPAARTGSSNAASLLIPLAAKSPEHLAGPAQPPPFAAAQLTAAAKPMAPAGSITSMQASAFASVALRCFSSATEQEEAARQWGSAKVAAAAAPDAQPAAEIAAAGEEDAACDTAAVAACGEPKPTARVARVAATLARAAVSLSPGCSGMLLDRGESMVVPVVPSTIFEHSIMAKPCFSNRTTPTQSFAFLLVNAAILLSLVAGAVVHVHLT